ncbi:MAG: hypothetical protein AUI14_03355 [Actinobacteria bacterium 13_2_20CM_2_71_6]|nr:MAG: hypothetical protein AUI14_03355 [Actinobacteria bacterium 13_2_20CM_2_71_6]
MAASSTQRRPASSSAAACGLTWAANGIGAPWLVSVFGSAEVSTPRRLSSAYSASVPANACRASRASGIGVAGGVTSKVAPSIRRMVPLLRLTAYAVADCWTTSSRSPPAAT